jgi:hypothetical protein
LRLDATTAASVNTSLGDLSDLGAVRTFVTDLATAAGGLAAVRRLLPAG